MSGFCVCVTCYLSTIDEPPGSLNWKYNGETLVLLALRITYSMKGLVADTVVSYGTK